MSNIRPDRIEYLNEKRNKIKMELKSITHYEQTESVAYGEHNPFSVDIVNCDTCQIEPIVTQTEVFSKKRTRTKYLITCSSCSCTIQAPQSTFWEAALMWNERNLGNLTYQELPLFGLKNLTIEEAKIRMRGIRHDLELRKQLAGLDLELSHHCKDKRPPGIRYLHKLSAYLKWAMLAQRLIKVTSLSEEKDINQTL